MIEVMFTFGTEHIIVVVDGNNIQFGNTMFGAKLATIEGLKLDKVGVTKEFPDLANSENWREEAIKRFKNKISEFESEDAKVNYLINDLKKFGYKPYYKQKKGFRKEVIH